VAWLTNEAGRLRPSPFWCGVWRLALSQQFDHAYRPVKREEVLRENDNFSLFDEARRVRSNWVSADREPVAALLTLEVGERPVPRFIIDCVEPQWDHLL
jgi:hypothetical protein